MMDVEFSVQYLVLGAKARAAIAGEYNVTCAHVRAVAPLVLRHRVMTNFHGEAEGVTPDKVVKMLLEHIGEPRPEACLDQLPDRLKPLAEAARPHYERLASFRLGANGRVKSHCIAGRCGEAGANGGRVEGLRLAVDEQGGPLWPNQKERTFFQADQVRVEAGGGEIGDCPCMIGGRVDHRLDRGRRPGGTRVSEIAFDLCHRQIVVLIAKQHQDRGTGIGAGFGNRAKSSAGVERDVGGKSIRSGSER